MFEVSLPDLTANHKNLANHKKHLLRPDASGTIHKMFFLAPIWSKYVSSRLSTRPTKSYFGPIDLVYVHRSKFCEKKI